MPVNNLAVCEVDKTWVRHFQPGIKKKDKIPLAEVCGGDVSSFRSAKGELQVGHTRPFYRQCSTTIIKPVLGTATREYQGVSA